MISMKTCWCGDKNQDEALRCTGCGTEFTFRDEQRPCTMRARVLSAAIFLFLGGLVLLWYLRPLPPRHELAGPEGVTSAGPDSLGSGSNSQSPVLSGVKSNLTSPSPTTGKSPDNLSNLLKGAEARFLDQTIRYIEFYGEVVDENSQPVEGAQVSFSETYTSGPVQTNTDANGLFSISGVSGAYLSVQVAKTGFYASKSNQVSFQYSPAMAADYFRPDANNPVIFHLRKKGAGVSLVTSQQGVSPEVAIGGLTNGVVKRFNFFRKQVASDGQLELRAVRPPRGERATNWSFRMSIPGGGLVEQQDEFPFRAPESGYRSSIEFVFQAGDTNWTETLHKRYYIVFGEPAKYGWLDVETGAYRGVSLRYAINPDGSRNLEPE
jgi:hypothetical protein